ncbi:MAG: AAA family ATPase [Lachnospiraceae bacterium]|nr:AAA family ATPase [Lachnospiraceae bacterium]
MFVGRKKELKYLEENYRKEGSRLLVLYGHRGVGKTALLKQFAQQKAAHYYAARPCSEAQQLKLWREELAEQEWEDGGNAAAQAADYAGVLAHIGRALAAKGAGKGLIVIDEFQHLIKYSEGFMQALTDQLKDAEAPCMVVLLSSSISFVETDFVPRIGSLALGISAFYKLPQMGFMDCVNFFKDYSTRQCMEVYSILGGIPAYWSAFDPKLSVEDNIRLKILAENAPLREEGERIVLAELRELNVYSTLLSGLSSGLNKLNELHVHSGCSRAKISVYLKNLMERELVEKIFPFDSASSANAKKGVYRVSLRFLEFYFCFVFSRQSFLSAMDTDAYFEKYVAPKLSAFHQGNFRKVCGEYLQILNSNNMLPIKSVREGEWIGKKGSIDIVLQDEEWENILAFCDWQKEVVGVEELEAYRQIAEEARLHADHMYLFAAGRFSDELKAMAEENKSLKLIDIDTL